MPGRSPLTAPDRSDDQPRPGLLRSNRGILIVFGIGVVVLGVVAVLLFGGGPIHVDPPAPTGAQAAVCHDLAGRLPATVDGGKRLQVTPESTLTAAWGGAPIVLRCGVPQPRSLTATSDLSTIDGIDWLPETVDGGTRFTSVGRAAYIEVTVPDSYEPVADALVDLGTAVRAADPMALSATG